jgi:UDP-N-acetylglucosamine acyltransferase
MTPFEKWPNTEEFPGELIREKFNYLPVGNKISDFAFVHPNVRMGDGNTVGEGAILRDGVVIGNNNYIGPYCIIGDAPEKVGCWDKSCGVVIGNNNRFTKQVTVDSGAEGITVIEDNTLMLKNAHVGHNALIRSGVILSCNSVIGGWTEVGNNTNFAIGAVAHQRLHIPEGCIIGMNGVVTKQSVMRPGYKYIGVPIKELGVNERN